MRRTRSGAYGSPTTTSKQPTTSNPTITTSKAKSKSNAKKKPSEADLPPMTNQIQPTTVLNRVTTRGTRRGGNTTSGTLQDGLPPTPDATQPHRTSTRRVRESDAESEHPSDVYQPAQDASDSNSNPGLPTSKSTGALNQPSKTQNPVRCRRPKRSRIDGPLKTKSGSNHRGDEHDEDSNDDDDSNDDVDSDDDDDSDINDGSDLLARLERSIGNASTRPDPTSNNQLSRFTSNLNDLDDTLPTLHDYQTQAKDWPAWRIEEVQDRQVLGNAVPSNILTEAKAIKKLYKKHKAILAMMAKVSSFTLDKALGELGGTRTPDCLRLWQRYSKVTGGSTGLKMPRKGEKGALGQRNRETATIWKGLSNEQKRVFHPPIFYSLSGLPPPPSHDDSDQEDSNVKLTSEERSELQKLYDDLVCTSKVSKAYAKVAAGIPEGATSLPDYNRRSLKCVEKLHNQIEIESNHMDFAYYFLTASNHAVTQGGSKTPGWCHEFTSHDEMSTYVEEKCNFATIFASQVQGLSTNAAIATVIGRNTTNSGIKVSTGDKVKGDLAKNLRAMLENTIKCKTSGFPRGPDPSTLLPNKGYPVELIQLPGSKLPPEILRLGFNRMNSKRSLWLDDLNAGLFTMKMIEDESNQQDVQMQNQELEKDKNDESNTNDNHGTGLDADNDMEQEEYPEWNGFGDADDE